MPANSFTYVAEMVEGHTHTHTHTPKVSDVAFGEWVTFLVTAKLIQGTNPMRTTFQLPANSFTYVRVKD